MNYRRMQKMIDFLRELPRNKFYFGTVIKKYDVEHKCGTVCCAIGWTPVIFPRTVEWDVEDFGSLDVDDIEYDVRLKNEDVVGYWDVAARLLDISERHAECLFDPESQSDIGLKDLKKTASPNQVANMLETYMKKIKNGDIVDHWK